MTASVDYYALLGIPRNASAADVRAAYRRAIGTWRMRAASSDESISEEAEKRLALAAEAYAVLSDTQRRAAYDKQHDALAEPPAVADPVSPAPTVAFMSSSDWIERAENYLANGDYHAAAGAAHEATTHFGDSAESWSVLSRANAGLNKLDDAIYEARRAIELNSQNPWYHADLASIYEQLSHWDDALREYQQASSLDATEPLFHLAMGGVWLTRRQPAKAMPFIEPVYQKAPDDETACYYYANALLDTAQNVPKEKNTEGYVVTSPTEIQAMRSYLDRARAVKHLDQETREGLTRTEAYLAQMEGYTFSVPPIAGSAIGMLGAVSDGGCGTTAIAIVLITLFIGAPLFALFAAFGMFSSNEIGGGFVALLISIGLGYLWYRSLWVPRWKVNARGRNKAVRYMV